MTRTRKVLEDVRQVVLVEDDEYGDTLEVWIGDEAALVAKNPTLRVGRAQIEN